MKLFKKLFSKNKKQKKEVIPEVQEENIPENCFRCKYCKRLIYPYEKRKTMANQKYHIRCFRKYKKEVKKITFNC